MSIATEIQRLQTAKAGIKSAIEAKGVTVPSATTIDGYASLIGQISQGVQEAPENDVNFYDYDGFRVASFTIAEAKALTQAEYNAILPPTHEGLTFQEWNWTLNDITTYNRRFIDIGANYITTDGKTHIKINVKSGGYIYFLLNIDSGCTVVVNYGDGQESSSTTGSNIGFRHTYDSEGDYDITITPTVTTTGAKYGFTNRTLYYSSDKIKEINIGTGFTFDNVNAAYNIEGKLSLPTDVVFGSAFMYSVMPQLNIPRGNHVFSANNIFRNINARLSLPKQIQSLSGSAALSVSTYDRIVIPEVTTGTFAINSLNTNYYLRIISIPASFQFASSNSNYFNNDSRLCCLDIVQGWIPLYSIKFDNNNALWSPENMVDLFTKLGTTTNAITLTFGSNNLNRLTADQKAIATNKGYTLA